MNITVSKLDTPIDSGDWHDAPMKWEVTGPGDEYQLFRTKKGATRYMRIRKESTSYIAASSRYVKESVYG